MSLLTASDLRKNFGGVEAVAGVSFTLAAGELLALIGEFEAILASPDIKASLTSVVLSANDPVAAWGGVKLLRERFGIEPSVVTGPATDNDVGVKIIREQMGVAAWNAMTNGASLGDEVIASLGLSPAQLAKAVSE